MDHVERVRVTMSLLPSAAEGGACESCVQPMYNKELFTPRTNPCVHDAYSANVVVLFSVKFDYNDNDSSDGFRNYRRGRNQGLWRVEVPQRRPGGVKDEAPRS